MPLFCHERKRMPRLLLFLLLPLLALFLLVVLAVLRALAIDTILTLHLPVSMLLTNTNYNRLTAIASLKSAQDLALATRWFLRDRVHTAARN